MVAKGRRLRSVIPPSALPGISPSRGEIGNLNVAADHATLAIGESRGERVISPLEGEMSARTEGGAVELNRHRLFALDDAPAPHLP